MATVEQVIANIYSDAFISLYGMTAEEAQALNHLATKLERPANLSGTTWIRSLLLEYRARVNGGMV